MRHHVGKFAWRYDAYELIYVGYEFDGDAPYLLDIGNVFIGEPSMYNRNHFFGIGNIFIQECLLDALGIPFKGNQAVKPN